jgi:hypothetical protein
MRSPSIQISPRVGPLDAGDDAHHRRLAGAVFADEHIDRAAPELQVRLLQRHDAGIGLRDVLQFENDVAVVDAVHLSLRR